MPCVQGIENMSNLSIERVKHLLLYFPESGEFFWKRRVGNIVAGTPIKRTNSHGYCVITVDGKTYKAHRLAWLYCMGYMPNGVIDHINGIRTDNRISNLRDVSISVNANNRHKPNKNNISGFLGVSVNRGVFVAGIRDNGKKRHLGSCKTASEAHELYLNFKSLSA